MRPIKFRAIYQSPTTDEPNKLLVSKPITLQDLTNGERLQVDFTEGGYLILDEMEPKYTRWIQSTGLHDKHNTEIWEGDVVQDKLANPAVVMWLSGTAAFVLKPLWNNPKHRYYWFNRGEFSERRDERINLTKTEVLGNIYESSHLLEKHGIQQEPKS